MIYNYPFPCRTCTNRSPGCHGSCEDYIKVKEEVAKLNKKKKKENEVRLVTLRRRYQL